MSFFVPNYRLLAGFRCHGVLKNLFSTVYIFVCLCNARITINQGQATYTLECHLSCSFWIYNFFDKPKTNKWLKDRPRVNLPTYQGGNLAFRLRCVGEGIQAKAAGQLYTKTAYPCHKPTLTKAPSMPWSSDQDQSVFVVGFTGKSIDNQRFKSPAF